ncbi:hypothetical protein THASP1DRAFT_30348 [Thamnocephalis sphaerospora]|uniref:Uncharacterized protein n=1 Tax=Thamnocephalis sphaerospora TaxID=78915 RepID=A0A4P9XRA9_9FUNG|nr:hypothetical protein THASP1DRAFT_30348 [Thamnocephalis sphaerospora]|eukprot:RKP07850.1 hypothetical protein THASP1DRAFT_30348 [Thamnocephalis sphaerospora]
MREPRRLKWLRISAIVVMFCGLAAFFGLQLNKLLKPSKVFQSVYSAEQIQLPSLLFTTTWPAKLNEIEVEFNSTWFEKPKVVREYESFHTRFHVVPWGQEIEETRAIARSATQHPAYMFTPENWTFSSTTTASELTDTRDGMYLDSLKLSWTSIPRINNTSTVQSHYLDIYVIDDPSIFSKAREKGVPIDLRSISPTAQARCERRTSCLIRLHKKVEQDGEKRTTVYTAHTVSSILSVNARWLSIEIVPFNPAADTAADKYTVETVHARDNFTALDLAGTMGGAISLVLAAFAFLFGQRRMRPWGVVQKYLLRNAILQKFPRDIVEVDTNWRPVSVMDGGLVSMDISPGRRVTFEPPASPGSSNPRSPSVHFDAQQRRITVYNNEARLSFPSVLGSSSTLALPEAGLPTAESGSESECEHTQANVLLEKRLINLEKAMHKSINDLEAFRLRTETFYMELDLFHQRKGASSASRGRTLRNLWRHREDES